MGVRLAEIFDVVAEHPLFARLPPAVGRAFRAVRQCRTRALGGHWAECESGHVVAKHYNACRNRSCPRCGFYRCSKWLTRQAGRLLGCPHNHMIFTVPHELNQIWLHNYAVLGRLLFRSVRHAVLTLAADPKWLGAMPGVLMALHTWGQQLFIHPHVHVLITSGGALCGGGWLMARRKHLFAVGPLRVLFMETFLAGLVDLAKAGRLRLPPGWGVAEVKQLARTLRHKRWNIELCERYEDPTAVLNYLGRYLNGGPIGESRLLRREGDSVWFRYKDYRREDSHGVPSEVMELSCVEFARRVLQHVPPAGFHMMRGYGLYRRGGGASEQLRRQAQEAMPVSPEVRASLSERHREVKPAPEIPRECPICGRAVWLRSRPRPASQQARAG